MIHINTQLISWINSNFGYNISNKYYEYIDEWLDWWRGYHTKFHRYFHNNGKTLIERDLYSLKMGKKVCEDWASILLNSKTKIMIDDEDTDNFVQGFKETGGVLSSNSFWVQANRLIEKAFATGTGAVVLHTNGLKMSNDRIKPSPDARIKLNYISADMIIPLSVDNGQITEVAFASEQVVRGKKYISLELHTLENGAYVISNYRFENDNGYLKPADLQKDIAAKLFTGDNTPWFAIVEPNIENDIEYTNGLGISVLHGALDALKAVDLCFNNFCSDFYLGGKKVFMKKDLCDITDDGKTIAPDDVNQKLFTYVDLPLTEDGKSTLLQEFNPALRTEENTKGVQSALDYLSFKTGLGNKHYQFNSGSIVTATQYTGDKQDLIQNAHKHYIVVEEFLLSLIRSIIHIGAKIIGANVREDAKIEIVFDKSVIIDEKAERVQDAQDVRDGVMPKWEYRMKWYGDTEDEAKAIIAEIGGEETDDELMSFGDGG